jgi:hypothetical protein
MSSPRPIAPSSGRRRLRSVKRTQRVQWMQRFMIVLTSGPMYLSSTARLFSCEARAAVDAVGHRLVLQVALAALVADRAVERVVDQQELHHALRAPSSPSATVNISGGSPFGPGRQVAHAHGAGRDGFGGPPFTSTRHMRQLPAIDSRSWKQKRGISAPAASHACSSVYRSAGTSISMPSTLSFGHVVPPVLRRVLVRERHAASRRGLPPRLVCASMRSSISCGNAGSGPGPARPPRRRARRSCGPRPAW